MGYKEMAIWVLALLLATTILLSPVACTMNRQQIIADAIKNGGDPIAIKCAIESSDQNPLAMCTIKAMERLK